jgi:hypothetical protein
VKTFVPTPPLTVPEAKAVVEALERGIESLYDGRWACESRAEERKRELMAERADALRMSLKQYLKEVFK